MTVKFPFIDFLKGVLILFVVWGHVLSGGYDSLFTSEGLNIRFIIYFFHMPLFFSISGYLLVKSKVTLRYLVSKVKILLAVYLLYTFFHSLLFSKGLDFSGLRDLILNSYNHLWYIVALAFFYIIILVIHRVNTEVMVLSLSILACIFTTNRLDLSINNLHFNKIIFRILEYFIYFYLGFVTRNNLLSKAQIRNVFLIIIASFSALFYLRYTSIFAIFFTLFNLILIQMIFSNIKYLDTIKYPNLISKIGAKTFFIYLTHYLLIIIFQKIIKDYLLFDIISFLVSIAIVLILYGINLFSVNLLKNQKVITKYLGL